MSLHMYVLPGLLACSLEAALSGAVRSLAPNVVCLCSLCMLTPAESHARGSARTGTGTFRVPECARAGSLSRLEGCPALLLLLSGRGCLGASCASS